jgi:hypothetical protein
MSAVKDSATKAANKLGMGGLAALAAGAVLVAGVTAVGAANGADDRPSANPISVAVPGDDDGTPDQGSGDAPGTPGGPSTSVTSTTVTVPSTTTPTSTTVPSGPRPTVAPPAARPRTVPVPGVGTVVFDEATLGLISATPAPGFTVRVESSARELHVKFFDSRGGRIDVQVEYEDGGIRVRVRDRRTEDRDDRGPRDDRPSTTVPSTRPTTTIDDNGGDRDRDDRYEPGDDRDSSGSGSDDDRYDDDDHDDDSGKGRGRGRGGDDD